MNELRQGLVAEVRDAALRDAVGRITDAARSRNLRAVAARAMRNTIRDHLLALNSKRHKYGRGYYAGASRAVSSQAVPEGARASVNYAGIRLRYFGTAGLPGGVLKPKYPRRFLTEPEDPEAYGKRAREISNLRFARVFDNDTGRLRAALIKSYAHTEIVIRRRKRGKNAGQAYIKQGRTYDGTEVFYWLNRTAKQEADPSVLPDEDVIVSSATNAAAQFMLQGEGGER